MLECKSCHKCEKRYPACHSTCYKYKIFRRLKDAENAKIRAEREREDRITTYIISEVEKNKRRRKGKL